MGAEAQLILPRKGEVAPKAPEGEEPVTSRSGRAVECRASSPSVICAATSPWRGRNFSRRTTLALAAALSACSFAPQYAVPSTNLPTAYKEQGTLPPAGWSQASPQDQAARGEWWRAFDDPVLDGLEVQVETASPTLAAALARYDAARAQIRVAAADAAPQLTTTDSVERDHLSAYRPLAGATGRGTTYTETILGGSATWEIDLWGRVRNEVKATRAEAVASADDLANVRLSLQTELADAYWRLRGFDAQLQLLTATSAAYKRALDLTVTRHNGGIANGLDVGRAQTVLSDARAELSSVTAQRAAVEHEIAAVIGQPASSFAIAVVQSSLAPPLIPAEAPAALLQRRPDVAEAERRVFAANARIGVAKAAFFPTVSLMGGGGLDATHSPIFSTPATYWAAGPAQAVLTLLDGGRHKAQLRIARANFDEAAANYRDTVLTAIRQVEDGLAAERLLAQQSTDQRTAATAAQRTSGLALLRYRDGASDYLDVVTAQTAALDAEVSALLVATQRMQAAVALVKALGGGFETTQTAGAGTSAGR